MIFRCRCQGIRMLCRMVGGTLLAIGGIGAFILFTRSTSNRQITQSVGQPPILGDKNKADHSFGTDIKSCVIDGVKAENDSKGAWNKFPSIVTRCVHEHSTITENSFVTFKCVNEEWKYFLPIRDHFTEPNCLFLTIGIGGENHAEKELVTRYPDCKVFGIESLDVFGAFAEVGTPIQAAVGVPDPVLPKIRSWNHYLQKVGKVVPLNEVMDQHLRRRYTDFLTIDIEGSEYEILYGLRHPRPLRRLGVWFCQIDVEFHNLAYWAPSNFSFKSYILDLLNDSSLVPIHAAPITLGGYTHNKVVLIDTAQEYCEKRFQFSSYSND